MWTLATIILVLITVRFLLFTCEVSAYKHQRRLGNRYPKATPDDITKPKFFN